jgi:ribosomal-protein-alanine N-acetyltransferase
MDHKMQIPSIKTERLVLRAFEPSDAEPLYQILSEEGVLRYFPNPAPPPREKMDKFISNQLEQWEQHGYAWWAVTLPSGSELLGWCGLQFLPETGETEVGYLLGKPWWGKGYATEAAYASLSFAFNDLSTFDQIIALVHPDNQASIRVIEKIGMHFLDHAQYFGMAMQRYRVTKEQFTNDHIQEKSS